MSELDGSEQRASLAAEGARMMTICNACRYCEGYCAVFPAMERRLAFAWSDMSYLANLCHQCGECYFACQYAPPHEFNVDLPRNLAQIRLASYQAYAWPGWIARAFNRDAVGTAVAAAVSIAGAMLLAFALEGAPLLTTAAADGDFYRAVPHSVMAGAFGALALFLLIAVGVGCSRAWRDMGEAGAAFVNVAGWREALGAVFSLTHLSGDNHGGGAGCSSDDRRRSNARRIAHHITFYSFLLCFAATLVATIYHFGFGWHAPYPVLSLPVMLGSVGGIGLVIGPVLLYRYRRQADPVLFEPSQAGLANALIVLLSLSGLSGLLLLALRTTAAMPVLLILHLAIVFALFLTLPYGKFVHGFYRLLALIKYALERRRTGTGIGGEG